MDPTISIAVLTVGGILKAPTEEFLKRIGGPAADELGAWLRDSIHDFRVRNTGRTIARAEEMLTQAERRVQAVPFRTLLPLLEGASLEDNPELGELWAALLANAANDEQPSMPPIFPSTLGQLTPFDARLLADLQAMEERGLPADPIGTSSAKPSTRWGARRLEVLAALPTASGEQLEVALNTLAALGLVENEPAVRAAGDDPHNIIFSDSNEFRLSALGRRFVRACKAPRPRVPTA